MSNESTNPEETTPARVQLNPTVDPETARAIPSLAPEATGDGTVEAAADAATIEAERGPLASTFTTGQAVEIPATESKLDADLEAEIAAAMQGVNDLSAGGVEPGAEPAPASPAKPSKGGKQQGPINPEEVTAGTRLTGKVVSVYGDSVILDLSGQASAAVPVKNFESGKVPAVGVTLALIAEQYDAAEGLIRCRVATGGGASKPQGNWEAVQTGMVVDCMVTKTNKGGLEVNVSNLRGFMPAAQVDLGFCSNLEQFVGQKLRAVVLEVNPQKRNLIVSRRQFLESTLAETREQAWNNLAVGQKVQGKVKTVKDYGAFVDLGGVDGLLHVSEMSWNRLNHPRDILSEGQDIEVQVLQLDREKMKISLGLKQLHSSPWLTIMEKFPIESTVRGKVTKATEFGAFVELEPGLEGMVHISELDYKRVVRVTDVMQVGKEYDLKVLSIDPNKKRIALSLKALAPRPEGPKKVADEDLAPSASAAPFKPKHKGPLKGGGTGSGGFSFGRPTGN